MNSGLSIAQKIANAIAEREDFAEIKRQNQARTLAFKEKMKKMALENPVGSGLGRPKTQFPTLEEAKLVQNLRAQKFTYAEITSQLGFTYPRIKKIEAFGEKNGIKKA